MAAAIGLREDFDGPGLRALAKATKDAARTVGDLWHAIAQAIETFTPTECQNYFAAAGYDCE